MDNVDDEHDDPCDGRRLFDPRTEVPPPFWEVIERGRRDRNVFRAVLQELSRAELKEFIMRLDELAGFFCEPPFVPPSPATNSEYYLQETGTWLISQGEAEFLQSWDSPKLFWELLAKNVRDHWPDESYLGLAEEEWWRRYPGEESP